MTQSQGNPAGDGEEEEINLTRPYFQQKCCVNTKIGVTSSFVELFSDFKT